MPTYQYACTGCGEQLDVVQSFSDPSLTVHEPGCGGPLRKVFGSVGVVFKGSGFYRTDSRSGPVAAEGTSEAKAEGKSSEAGSSESKPATEAKPAAKSESSGSSGGTSSGTSSGSSTAAA